MRDACILHAERALASASSAFSAKLLALAPGTEARSMLSQPGCQVASSRFMRICGDHLQPLDQPLKRGYYPDDDRSPEFSSLMIRLRYAVYRHVCSLVSYRVSSPSRNTTSIIAQNVLHVEQAQETPHRTAGNTGERKEYRSPAEEMTGTGGYSVMWLPR